jgi:hypothetical protein
MQFAADDPEGQRSVAAFQQALQRLGWSEGRDVQIDIRWGRNDVDRDRKYAAELIALAPDSPLLAQSRHDNGVRRCSLSGVKRTLVRDAAMSVIGVGDATAAPEQAANWPTRKGSSTSS